MKVLIWTQCFWPENFHINAVARNLHAQGVEVTVLTGKPNYPDGNIFDGYKATGTQHEEYSGVEVIRIPIRPRGSGSAMSMMINYLSFILSGYLFGPYALRGKKFDAVFVYATSPLLQALPAIFVAWLKRAPMILWVQDIWPDALESTGFIKNRWILQAVGLAVSYIYHFSDSILIQSEGFRPFVERWTGNRERIQFFPNSVEEIPSVSSDDSKITAIVNELSQGFSVLFAGNIGTAQACETIIEAATLLRSISSIKFYLVGSGSMSESIGKSIAVLGLENVVMTGQVPAEHMAAVYASSSVLLLTLRDEPALSSTIPSKLQSYLAAEKPIIVCANGESAKILSDANAGLTCPAGDATALAATVSNLYAMPAEKRACMGKNGREYFKVHFQLENRVTQLANHLSQVCNPLHC